MSKHDRIVAGNAPGTERQLIVPQEPVYPPIGEIWQRAVYLGCSPSTSKQFVTVPFEGIGFVDMDIVVARELVSVMNEQADLGLSRWRVPTASEAETLLRIFMSKMAPTERYVRAVVTNENRHGTPLMVYPHWGKPKRGNMQEVQIDNRLATIVSCFRPVCNIT